MPVPLPEPTPGLPFSAQYFIPPTPNDPPNFNDVIRTKEYAQRALISEKYPGQIDEASTAKALIYADSILGAASGGAAAPSWFAPALHAQLDVRFNQMETRFNQVDTRLDHINMRFNVINARLDDIETHLDDIDTSLGGIDTRLDEIKAVAVRMAVFAAKNHNHDLGNGIPVPFVPVPFPDGSLPSANINTPTAITNLTVLRDLAYHELRAYCTAYYPGQHYGIGRRREALIASIRQAIGCAAS